MATLEEGINWARRSGKPCRVMLHDGLDVQLPVPVDLDGPEGPARSFSHMLGSIKYWAAPLDLVVIPNALFLPTQSTILSADLRLCEELVYGIYANDEPMIWKAGGQPREVSDWFVEKLEAAPAIPGVHSLIHPRWHNIYTHWFTEALAALYDSKICFDLLDSICIPNGPAYQNASLALANFPISRLKVLDEPAYRFEVAVLPTHLLARTWVHPAAAPGLKRFAAEIKKNCAAATVAAGPPVYLSREDATARRMLNEQELAAALEKIGFAKVIAGELTFAEQVAVFARAPAIVSPHGSGLTNMLFQPAEGRILELRPINAGNRGNLWDRSYQVLAALLGLPYSALVYENPHDEENWSIDIGFTVEKAKRFLDGLGGGAA